MKRALLLPGLIILAGGLCFGQDLVEAAKKEKDRREAQKSGKAIVITNMTLSELKKKPSVPTLNSEGGRDLAAGSAGMMKPAAGTPGAAPAPLPGPEPESPGASMREQEKADVQNRYDRAKERLDLLGLKMLSLRQQLTTFDSMQTKDKVQKEFAETYQTFLQAQAELAKAKEDLDRVVGEGGATTPSSTIK